MAKETAEPDRAGPHRRVVVGVDGSEGSTRALEWAAAEADRNGAVLEVLAAYDAGELLSIPRKGQRAMELVIEKALAHVAMVAPGVEVKGVAQEGFPARALIEASRGADLLVVGARGLGGFTGLLLGSVSQQCSHHAHCAVAVVPALEEPPESLKRSADALKRLADAYDVSTPTLDAIAGAIIAGTRLTDGKYARDVVMNLVAFIVEDVGTLAALEKGGKLTNDVLERMDNLIASDPPATWSEWDVLQIVLDNVRFALRPPSTAG